MCNLHIFVLSDTTLVPEDISKRTFCQSACLFSHLLLKFGHYTVFQKHVVIPLSQSESE